MGWTEEGRAKARAALIRKYGGEDGYRAELKRRAALGGVKGGGKGGFTVMNKLEHIKVSSRGGRTQRRKGTK